MRVRRKILAREVSGRHRRTGYAIVGVAFATDESDIETIDDAENLQKEKRMSIFDRFKDGVDLVKHKVDQQIRINAIQREVNKITHNISGLRMKIANVVLDLHKEGVLTIDELEELCNMIDEANGQIKEKQEQITFIRDESTSSLIICPNCGEQIPSIADFCPECGKKIIQNIVSSDEEE